MLKQLLQPASVIVDLGASALHLGIMRGLWTIALALCLATTVSQSTRAALTITNGDFDDGIGVESHQADVATPWYDFTGANFYDNAWQISVVNISPTDTPVLALSAIAADETLDGAGLNGYAYQSIGTADGASDVAITFDWGSFDDAGGPRDLGITFSILESDGTFVPDDATDILGASGVTLIDQQSMSRAGVAISQMFSEKWTFDLSSAGSGELFLRLNNFETAAGAGGNQAWVAVDNVEIPGPAMTLMVNETSGETKILNDTPGAVPMNYYLIESDQGSLNPADAPAGWDSLEDQGMASGLPADFDGSGVVDQSDKDQWESDYGMNAGSDADGDGDSDGADFLIWQRQFGQAPGPGYSWAEAGGVDDTQLGELLLQGTTTLAASEELSLGSAYESSVAGVGNGDLKFFYAEPGDSRLTEGNVVYVNSAATAVPEPAGLALYGLGLAGLTAVGRRRV